MNDSDSLHKSLEKALEDVESFTQNYEPVYKWANANLGFETMVNKIEAVYVNQSSF